MALELQFLDAFARGVGSFGVAVVSHSCATVVRRRPQAAQVFLFGAHNIDVTARPTNPLSLKSMDPEDERAWKQAVEQNRERKERYFRENQRSPIPPELRGADFPGLDYYEVDSDYRYELELERYDDPETVTVETTADGEQTYRRVGQFRFEVDGNEVSLDAFEPTDGSDRLWVPFRDATSGDETYGAGRYIDLEPEENKIGDDAWVLDLNRAYNPTCAYNPAYECPLVPSSNWLDVPLEAGERDFPADIYGDH